MSFDCETAREFYRVIYLIRRQNDIWLVHAFKKKTQKLHPEMSRWRAKD